MITLGGPHMNATAVATVLSLASLVGVAVVLFQVDDLSDKVQSLSRSPGGDVVPVEAPGNARVPDRFARAEFDDDTAAPDVEVPEGTPAAAPTGTLENRLARLERAEKKRARGDRSVSRWRPPSYASNVNDLATKLKLTPAQKDRVKSVVDRAKQQIEDVMKIPDADGKSPHERRTEQRKKMMEAIKNKDTSGVFSFAHDAFSYRKKAIPGQNSTYGQAIDRIKKEARDEIGSTLSNEQKETFDDMKIDPMLGGGGAQFASFALSAPGIDGDAVVVETAIETTEDLEEAPEPKEAGKKADSGG